MIIIRGLNKAFGEKIIFSNFNLEIPDGSFVVISGIVAVEKHFAQYDWWYRKAG